jgi:PTS system nitrogen regulatory IIA component
VPGDRRDAVLEAVSQLPGIPNNIVRSLLLEVLIGREALASTAVGDGVALQHPRDPLVVPVEAPTVLICFPARPIDFGALDGKPIHTVFLLLSPTVRAHLQMLVRVAYALRDAKLTEMLPRHAPRDAILERLGGLERESAENSRGAKP